MKTKVYDLLEFSVIMFLLWLCLLVPRLCQAQTFKEYINQPIQYVDEQKELRIEWNNFCGFDMFKSYFVVKDLEKSFREYASVDFGKLKGIMKIGENYESIEYKFKIDF